MAQYIDIDGVDTQVGSIVEIEEENKTLLIDGNEFSVGEIISNVEDLTSTVDQLTADIQSLGQVSSEYQLTGNPGDMAYKNSSDWTPSTDFTQLKQDICNALSDITTATTSFDVDGIVSVLYSIKTALQE